MSLSPNNRLLLLILLWLKSSGVLFSQSFNFPESIDFNSTTQVKLARLDSNVHSGIQPYIHFFSQTNIYASKPVFQSRDTAGSWIKRVVTEADLILVDDQASTFKLKINPLFNLQAGKDQSDSTGRTYYTNTRGVFAAGSVGKKFYFETMFAENQSVFPSYISNAVKTTQVVPGQGRWKNFKTDGYDYAFSSGFVSMMLRKNINLQIGHGKQKIGYGYRSLLLSDNSFNYPYLRVSQEWLKGKLQYTNIYSVLMNLVSASTIVNPNTERLFQKKCASFQYLSFNPNKRFNLGLFQSIIWQPGDAKNRQNLSWQYFNPLIFSNLPMYGLDDRNNINIGADARIKITPNLSVYGQYMLDRLRPNNSARDHFGWQIGAHYYLKRSEHLLHIQVELNELSATQNAYSHYGQTLSYTPGEGRELTGLLDYHYKRFFCIFKHQQQGHLPNQSNENYINITEARLGIVVNPAYNMNLSLGCIARTQNFNTFKNLNNETKYFYIAFRTSIFNTYYDF